MSSLSLSASTYNFAVSLAVVGMAVAVAVLNLVRSTEGSKNPGFYWSVNPVITVLALLVVLVPFSWAIVATLLTFCIFQLVVDYNNENATNTDHSTSIDWIITALAIALLALAWFVY